MKDLNTLVSKMTLKEKLAQITQLYPVSDDDDKFMGIDYHHELQEFLHENIGSFLGVAGAARLKALQDKYLQKSTHKIPLIFMHDIIHGYKTIFPSCLAMACSWQPELIEKYAVVAAKEASVSGIHLTFSPMCDLARDARWGRVVESGGEDAYLNSLYAAAYVRGYQKDDVSGQFNIAACVKHFAAYGLAEAGRDYNTTEASEHQLFEYLFPAYQSALEAGAKSIMTSFNALNGVPASGNRWLFTDVLRNLWNFSGMVISDCTAIMELIYHGFAKDGEEAAYKAIDAGVDMEMVSTTYYENAEKLITDGKLNIEQIDRAVLKVLQLKDDLGLFENPYKDADENLEKEYILCEEHRNIAREIARESIVLLENNGILPLVSNDKKIALIGPLGDSRQMLDTWSAYGDEADCVTLLEALREQGQHISYALGCGMKDYSDQEAQEALLLAKASDIIILALGEEPMMSGESNSRTYIGLPGKQEQFAQMIFALNKPVAVVLYSGRPLAVSGFKDRADALIEAWLPGTEGNRALSDILLGKHEPSARLTMSFPYNTGQCPIYYNRYSTGRPAKDPVNSDRFTSRYVDAPSIPLYPFGYGLSYTTFEYEAIALSADKMNKDETIHASCVIKNIGGRTGTETVQLYLRDVSASIVRPIRMLKGFKRVTLNPGESVEATFEIDETMLRFYHAKGFTSEPGTFKVFIGKDAAVEECAEFELV